MRKYLLIWLTILPVICSAQSTVFQKLFSANRHSRSVRSPDRACSCQPLNTAVLFPRPPEIKVLKDTLFNESNFTVKACIMNLKSADGIRLTLNGEEQPLAQQVSSTTDAFCPNGYSFSYTLIKAKARNIISLEAHNEGGATLRYLEVPARK